MCSSSPPWQMPPSALLDSAFIRSANIQKINSSCIIADNIVSNNINTNTITILSPPVNGTDGTNKDYVDSKLLFDWKNPVLVATTGNISLSGLPGTIDGYPVTTDDRILVHKQINSVDNGIYLIKPGSWQRASDLDTGQHASGAAMWVLEGTQYKHTSFVCDNLPSSDIVGTDPLIFVQFSGGNGAVIAGNALTLTGNTLDVNVNSTDISINLSNQLQLTTTSVVSGSYGSLSSTPTFTVDSKGRLTQASSISSFSSNIFKIINYTSINSLPYNISASELLGGYIVVNGNISGNLILPSVPSIVSQIGLSNYVTNMSFNFTIAKNGNNNMMIILDPSITNPLGIDLEVKNRDIDYVALVLTSQTTGVILPVCTDHTF